MAYKNKGEALSREAAVMRALAKDIAGLQELGLAALQGRYLEVFGEHPRSKNLPYLRKKIAFRIQEQMEGGLSQVAMSRVQELSGSEISAKSLGVSKRPVLRAVPSMPLSTQVRDSRLPLAGRLITREFKGFLHEVKVLEVGAKSLG